MRDHARVECGPAQTAADPRRRRSRSIEPALRFAPARRRPRTDAEQRENPRSRSARLRIAERLRVAERCCKKTTEQRRIAAVLSGLVLAVVMSAIGVVVYTKHETRKLFIELAVELSQPSATELEYRLGSPADRAEHLVDARARIEQLARETDGHVVDPSRRAG